MTKSAKFWILIVLITGESLSHFLTIFFTLILCLSMMSTSLCGHHMAEHALDLVMLIWLMTPDLGNIVM